MTRDDMIYLKRWFNSKYTISIYISFLKKKKKKKNETLKEKNESFEEKNESLEEKNECLEDNITNSCPRDFHSSP